jgi:ubiquinone/menaquinone biosynthesis C-methylase UbiE
MDVIEYHLKELKAARDCSNPAHCKPDILPAEKVVIDIGCGIGQFFLASDMNGRIAIGVDVDPVAVSYGIQHYGEQINFVLGDASHVPLPDHVADLIVSRVSLPYTHIPKVIREVKRLLKPRGRLWVTLHSRSMVESSLREAWQQGSYKNTIRQLYVLVNGYLFSYMGLLLPFKGWTYESWQDIDRFARMLQSHGFEVNIERHGRHQIVEARAPSVD